MEMFYILIVMANTHKCIHLSEFIKLQHLKLMDFVACKLCFSKIHFKSIWELFMTTLKYLGFPGSSAGKESACNAGDPGSIPGLGRSAGEGIGYPLQYSWASLVAQLVENLPVMRQTWVWSLHWEDPLEMEMATHSSILAWRVPWGHKESDMTEWLSLLLLNTGFLLGWWTYPRIR